MQVRLRPTREGLYAGLLAACLGALALATGDNLLYLLLSLVLAAGLVDLLLGGLNLRGLEVVRLLPAELFAEVEARGRYALRSRRRTAAFAVCLEELGGEAQARVERARPGAEESASAPFTFPERGLAHLDGVRLSSTWPFGLALRSRVLPLPAQVLVWPRPLPSPWRPEPGGEGHEGGDSGHVGGVGDFVGLRPYVPGDPLRAVHWPTTARVGRPFVSLRSTEAAARVVVRVDEGAPARERELSRATGELIRAFARGMEVGLEVGAARHEPRPGAAWRRALLDELARAPRGDG